MTGGGENSIGIKQLGGNAHGAPLLEVWGSCHVSFYMASIPLNCQSGVQFGAPSFSEVCTEVV